MQGFLREIRAFFRKGDMLLLILCLATTAFGCLVIASTTNATPTGPVRYLGIQIAAALIGIFLYAIFSSVDAEFFSEHRRALFLFNMFLLLLLIPFGTDNQTGNKSWLAFSFLPFNIQPAEICKIVYILIMASVMAAHQQRISHVFSVAHIVFHLLMLVGLNLVLSKDAGVSLIFIFIFAGMAYAGGVSLLWFLLGAGLCVPAGIFTWNRVLDGYQKKRILILFDPTIDPAGQNERYHTMRSLRSLTGGGMTGQGLFNGTRTQASGALFAQHTDYIFSAIGEELGYVGCTLVLVMLVLIIARCIWVGNRSQDYMRRLICYGVAAALIFQVISNVGMCIGVTPVIGLTLPFISYGGSSLVSMYAMMGLVSGVYARPAPASHELYVRPY